MACDVSEFGATNGRRPRECLCGRRDSCVAPSSVAYRVELDGVAGIRAGDDGDGLRREGNAECAFAVVERGLTTEGGPHETALPTFVSRRFVDASDGNSRLRYISQKPLEQKLSVNRELRRELTEALGEGHVKFVADLKRKPASAGSVGR